MASIPFYGYNYDPNCTDSSATTGQGIYTITWGPSRYGTGEPCSSNTIYSTNYVELPPDDVEEVVACPSPQTAWFLQPRETAPSRLRARPPRGPARCRDPP